jgi:phosphoribosylaminoimidazole-succinocarboxamide synthase
MSNGLVRETNLTTEFGEPKRGKVRDVYDLGDYLLIVVTDRVSAFDVILPGAIPDKGKTLNQLSGFWFLNTGDIVGNHMLTMDPFKYPVNISNAQRNKLRGRSMLVKKAKPFPVECVVRGYLSGSGWAEYKEKGSVCGIRLPDGLKESDRLDSPIFTPTTKAEEGHDVAINFAQTCELIGENDAEELRRLSLALYKKGASMAEERGIIIADTKFEFGKLPNGDIILIDEVLTPDSSRFWLASIYQPGQNQDSFDKQIVRDYLNTLDWDKTYPGPKLPPEIIEKTAERYREIFWILTRKEIE